jgi:ABC-2 type transport system permease protein
MQTKYWLRLTFSIIFKEIRIMTRYKAWMISIFLWPIGFPLTIYYVGKGLAGTSGQGLGTFGQLAQTVDFASFLILGNIVFMFVNANLWNGGLALQQDRVRGMFDTHWTLPVSKISLVIGATGSSLITRFLPMLLSITFYSMIGTFQLSGNLFSIIFSVLIIMPFLFGFLITFSALTIRMRQANVTVEITRNVLTILCGLQFPLAVLPKSLFRISQYIPLTHFMDMVRGIIIHKNSLAFYADSIRFIMISGLIMLGIGLILFRLVIKNIKKSGLVAGY